MKKILTLAVVLFAVTAAFAAEPPRPNYGKVSIKSRSNEFIQVVIDGKRYNMDRSDFVVDNLRPGRHSIQIYKARQFGFRTRPQMIYNSTMNVKPWELIDININRNERVSVTSRIDPADRYGRDGRNDRNDRGPRYGDRDDRYGRY
jgi:hypothetical protein